MISIWCSKSLVLFFSVLGLIGVSLGYTSVDDYFIDCGSSKNSSVGNRVFVADQFYSNILSTPQNVLANTTDSNSLSSLYGSVLSQTARIFTETSHYTFPIKKSGRHWIRLYFFPFNYGFYNLSTAKFSVTAQNFTLFKDYDSNVGSGVREYSVNVISDRLVIIFTPSANSFAFINALEVLALPDGLIPGSARSIDPQGKNITMWKQALETVERVNMGNQTVPPQNDSLWRLWVSDYPYLKHNNLGHPLSNIEAVNVTKDGISEYIAPAIVYGTATVLNSASDASFNANATWLFDVDPGFEYLVRFHFCDILTDQRTKFYFNVYLGSSIVYQNLDLRNVTTGTFGTPYFFDITTRVSDVRTLTVSVGPSVIDATDRSAILNGLEIMKISNSKDSLDVSDSVSPKGSKIKVLLVVGLAVGLTLVILFTIVLLVICRRQRKKANLGLFPNTISGVGTLKLSDGKYANDNGMLSTSKFGYRFAFVDIQDATDNFSECLVLGVGGFGKVYKGVLRDGTTVAVKRGNSSFSQGVAEFRTEIEMLSQFRHRHLVSLIGYCDERGEMIIIYEYMEKGTLKEHLYGSNQPSLSWRQRLDICIGAAKGLHYLHTGSAKAIIHRDVKSANILLDENLMAKVADFGLSKTGPEIDQTHVSTAVKGSFGYLDPEYLIRQQLTEKSDVYSFGVVMFEVLCGRAVIDPSLPREKVNLVEWATKFERRGQLEEVIDPLLEEQVKEESLKKFRDIAEKCLAERGVDRPAMGDVLWNLEYALQLQGNEQRLRSVNRGNNFESSGSVSASDGQLSIGSMTDLTGVSMSEVFAQMVREDMR
ncbi:hypothetical protein K2173_020466 [Erythroxylum novogranatense]|uniref:Protein kinase domain-containing protein n=1 Tax=Erythroxylum novogranatense TaxID=1862640 RepID=A0AAV8TI99_9ROSI|nr:hypothetical protein K2173_020466 [Erythroxylum novogranatense]